MDEECRSGKCCSEVNIDLETVSNKVGALEDKREKRLRVATWNFSGLCSERKQKEVRKLLVDNNIDIVAGQESWEKEDSKIEVEGYKWLGKPRNCQNSQRGEGEVGFFSKGVFDR